MGRLPQWIRRSLASDGAYTEVCGLVSELGLHTVCESARCPNRVECWNRGTATLMILGDRCSRHCRFCAVEAGVPEAPDGDEPRRVAEAVARLRLRHAVITSVTRDDLPDGGAAHFRRTIEAVRARCPEATIEVLTPDFEGRAADVQVVLDARPDVFAHNLETVERLQAEIRPQAGYARSLEVLRQAAGHAGGARVKSGLMVGLGETDAEIAQAMRDMLACGCRILTVGQYLAPTRGHWPVLRYVTPGAFDEMARLAMEMGFEGVESGPLVRSSYRAERVLQARGVPCGSQGERT